MYRVLLVDDDMIVRMYLNEIVRWEEHGFNVVGTASNGEQAIDLCRQQDPDLILTDISMPRMDGVRMIQHLRQEGYDGVILVLSCHDDFELVKSAMKQGADDYLLKNHLSSDSMGELLEKIRAQVDERREQSRRRQTIQTFAHRGLRSAQRELMEDMLRGEYADHDMTQKMQQAGLHGKYRRVAMILVRAVDADKEQEQALFDLCMQRMKGERAEVLPLSAGILMLLVDLSDMPSAGETAYLLGRLKNMVQAAAEQYLNVSIAQACSAVCEGKDALMEALKQAYLMLQHGFYGSGRWQYGVDKPLSDVCPLQAELFIQQLPELLKETNEAGLRNAYKTALEQLCQGKVSPGVLLQWLRRCDQAAGVIREEHQYGEIRSFSDCFTCVDAYEQQRQDIQQMYIPVQVGYAVRRAAQYVQEHYAEPIGLANAAEAAELTTSYLSALFKKEMGVGFAEYLLNIRLNQVKRWLRDSDTSIAELSNRAGFTNYQHFCKTFKKKVGMSPRDYRQRIREGNRT